MLRLAAVIYVLAFTVLAGGIITALLTINRVAAQDLSLGALAGAVLALPVAWVVARQINNALAGR